MTFRAFQVAALVLAMLPLFGSIGNGQETTEPPTPVATTLHVCTIKTYCVADEVVLFNTRVVFVSDPKPTETEAMQQVLEMLAKYSSDFPCPAGSREILQKSCVEVNPLRRAPSGHLCNSQLEDCCPDCGRWVATVRCTAIDPDGKPHQVESVCYGPSRLKAKRAAEANMHQNLCDLGWCCQCRTVCVERVECCVCSCH